MGRTLPTDCLVCGGVADWGDFGPDPEDNLSGTTCTCEPTVVLLIREWIKEERLLQASAIDTPASGLALYDAAIGAYQRVLDWFQDD